MAVLNANYIREPSREDATTSRITNRACTSASSPTASRTIRRHHARHRQAPARLRLPPADDLLPADRAGAMMIEPTETETPETLDSFIDAMLAIAREAQDDPELVLNAPDPTPVRRLDEARAARKPVLRWEPRSADGES